MIAFFRKTISRGIFATGLLCSPSLHAADLTTFPTGSFHQNVVSIGKKQIPLPAGKWEFKFSSSFRGDNTFIANSAEKITILLIQRTGDTYSGGVLIRTNDKPANGEGWPRDRRVCDRKNVHFNMSDRDYNPNASDCWQINHFVSVYPTSKNPIYNQMKRWGRKHAGTPTFLVLQHVVNDAYDIMRVDYIVNPTSFGFPSYDDREWSASQWHRNFLGGDAESERAVAVLQGIGKKLHPLVQKGFQNELHGYVSDFSLSLRP